MSGMSSTDATTHAINNLIHTLYNPPTSIPLITIVNMQKESLISLAKIFVKSTSPAVPPRVPARGAYQ